MEEEKKEENLPMFSSAQLAEHNKKEDIWLSIEGKVYDVTQFLNDHPGGSDIMMENAGKEATKEFLDIGHSSSAKKILHKYLIGHLTGYVKDADPPKKECIIM